MNKNLIFTNDIPSQFARHQEYVKEMIEFFYKNLKLNCEIKIKFVENFKTNEFEVTDCVIINASVKKHELLITNRVLNTINFDGGDFFCSAIFHEFEHIKDYINMMETKLFKFNFCSAKQTNFERQYVSTGFLFWTEIHAYFKTIKFSKENEIKVEKITFGNLVKNYIKTIELNKKYYYKQDLTQDEATKYVNCVNSFVYLCAKFMASLYANNSRIQYAKTKEDKNYKKVFSILSKLEPKILRIMKNPYCSKSYDNLFSLGKYICEDLCWKKFKIGLSKLNSQIHQFY